MALKTYYSDGDVYYAASVNWVNGMRYVKSGVQVEEDVQYNFTVGENKTSYNIRPSTLSPKTDFDAEKRYRNTWDYLNDKLIKKIIEELQ